MTSHTRLSPGIELHEIDRSQYQKTDYSVTGSTVFVCGFADKGETYTPQWINTMQTFEQLFGSPKTEAERYLWEASNEVLAKGGVCVASRLPYDNQSKDMFTTTWFSVQDQLLVSGSVQVDEMFKIDPSLTSSLSVGYDGPGKNISLARLDQLRTGMSLVDRNRFVVVDITRGDYGKMNVLSSDCRTALDDVECLGLMPVVVTPANAMFYQNLISSCTSCEAGGTETTTMLTGFQPICDAVCRRYDQQTGQISADTRFSRFSGSNFAVSLSSTTVDDHCVARMAVDMFPAITYNLSAQLDRQYLKQIGLVVFRVFKDPANDGKIGFTPVESFVGSLDRLSKNERSGASNYIGDVVNQNSEYVNLFANVPSDTRYRQASTIATAMQTCGVIGFLESERAKHIDYKNSIIDPLNAIFQRVSDPNQIRIDVVEDAGVTTIAAFAKATQDMDKTVNDGVDLYNGQSYPALPSGYGWFFDNAREYVPAWLAVTRKYDDFCKNVRRDCIFVSDIFRPVVLDGNEKSVRATNTLNTIQNTIVQRLKYLSSVNSSWSAGYSNWFYSANSEGNGFFWCPPSIKMGGVYIYTDVYFHPWDAPAGMNRGVIQNVYDVSFNPRNDEAGKIYQHAWNYAVNYPIEGIVAEGQKTFQLNQTALDRVNVRRLMIWLEKNVVAVARRFLYEGNTEYMRQRFVDSISPILEEAKTGYGILDYAIKCDDTINTDEVIDNHELRCIIAVKPVKTIEWIRIDFIVTNQRADVREEVLR